MTKNERIIPVESLFEMLDCDFSSGVLVWKTRPESHFSASNKRTARHVANNWNAIYSGKQAFTAIHRNRYFVGSINGKNNFAHRIIYAMKNGKWPEFSIDHIDGNGFNNSAINLRDVPHSENMKNVKTHVDNTTGFVGVCFSRPVNKFEARIHVDGKPKVIGYFNTAIEAGAARADASKANGYHENHGRKM